MEEFSITVPGQPGANPPLVLSAPGAHDVDAVYQICQDPDIAHWTTIPSPYHRQDAENFCTTVTTAGWELSTLLAWAIRESDDGEPLGMVSLRALSYRSWEIGYWAAPAARGRGIMTAAVRAVIQSAFDPDGPIAAPRIEWRCEVDDGLPNWASWRIAWRLGFRKIGKMRHAAVNKDRLRDVWVADLLCDDPLEPQTPWDGPIGDGGVSDYSIPEVPSDAIGVREGDAPEGLVETFHRIYGTPIFHDHPNLDYPHLMMRLRLIAEEYGELLGAVLGPKARGLVDDAFTQALSADEGARDVVGAADALADLVYVIYGMALESGIDLPAVLAEVQRSNMSKLAADGTPIYREDGKVMKGPGYRAPDIAAVLARSGWQHD